MGHTFSSLFTRNQLPKMQVEGETHIHWKQTFPKVEAQDLFFSAILPIPFLSVSLRPSDQEKSQPQVWKSSSPLPVSPVLNTFLLVLGYRKGLEGSRAGSLSLQERAVKHLSKEGQMHLELLSNACLVNPNADLGGTNTGKFNRSREWGFTCHKLCKLNWVTIS